ncbi:hypothetical protein BKA70DRAFT_1110727 [Coprinopsis sp. MPI-PUGE-AT-0042]|nr:hypothetical protein BKA70DRAFT_1110727 [Coprinopsis sp. MPI-PUGE-AT-0042]
MKLLQKLRAYVSGSTVLANINDEVWPCGDMDIYVPPSGSEELRSYLLSTGQHRLWKEVVLRGRDEEDLPDPYLRMSGIAKIWYFKHKGGKDINVIVTSTRSALIPIIDFHSTIVMNFITYFGIVSLYGRPTGNHYGWINIPAGLTHRDERWLNKYEGRGYLLYSGSDVPGPWVGHRCGVDVNCTVTVRNLLDDGVVVRKFAKYRGEHQSTLLQSLEPAFVWKLRNTDCFLGNNPRKGFVHTIDEHFVLV